MILEAYVISQVECHKMLCKWWKCLLVKYVLSSWVLFLQQSLSTADTVVLVPSHEMKMCFHRLRRGFNYQ